MAFNILAGPYLNHLTLVASAPTMSPTAVTGFPVTNLYDNRSSLPALFSGSSSATALTVTCDLNRIAGPGFETTGDEDYWTVLGAGTAATSSSGYAGSWSLRLTPAGGASGAVAIQDITARAGEALTFTAAARATSGTTAYVKVRNRQTGNFLGSTGAWSASTDGYATGAYVVSNATTSAYVSQSVSFTVESLDTCKEDAVTLRVYCLAKGTAAANFDSVLLWPTTDWVSVHGHNFAPFLTPTLQYSTTASTWDNAASLTLKRDSFHRVLSSTETISTRYVRLSLSGAVDQGEALPYMGELVLGQSDELVQNPNYGGAIAWTDRQARLQSSIGDEWVHLHGGRPVRKITMGFNLSSTAEYDQLSRQLFRGSRGGSNLICIAPTEFDADQVVLGRIRESITVEKVTAGSAYTAELEVSESPLPSLTSPTNAFDASYST